MQSFDDLSSAFSFMEKESDCKIESYFAMEPTPITYPTNIQQFVQDPQHQLGATFGHEHDHHHHHNSGTMNIVNNMVYPDGRKRATKACNACKQRHTRCGFERPCLRCTTLGYECVDPPSKKRGSKKNEHKHSIEKGQKMKTEMRIKAFIPNEMNVNQKPIQPIKKAESMPSLHVPYDFAYYSDNAVNLMHVNYLGNLGNQDDCGILYLNLNADSINDSQEIVGSDESHQ